MSLQTQGPPKVCYLLTRQSVKIVKGEKLGVLSAVLYLAPAETSGHNVCPWSTPECRRLCLQSSGRMKFDEAQRARLARTRLFFEDRAEFKRRLFGEIDALIRAANRKGMVPMVRLNGTSDIPWEKVMPEVFETYSTVQFYDYTKSVVRILTFLSGGLPKNYHLTFSRSELNEPDCVRLLAMGATVAMVFPTGDFPSEWFGWSVVDGDDSDVRPWDPPCSVVGLKAKGKARKKNSPFIVT